MQNNNKKLGDLRGVNGVRVRDGARYMYMVRGVDRVRDKDGVRCGKLPIWKEVTS